MIDEVKKALGKEYEHSMKNSVDILKEYFLSLKSSKTDNSINKIRQVLKCSKILGDKSSQQLI
jgi:hypothetical protein